jgi:hypothetical protein
MLELNLAKPCRTPAIADLPRIAAIMSWQFTLACNGPLVQNLHTILRNSQTLRPQDAFDIASVLGRHPEDVARELRASELARELPILQQAAPAEGNAAYARALQELLTLSRSYTGVAVAPGDSFAGQISPASELRAPERVNAQDIIRAALPSSLFMGVTTTATGAQCLVLPLQRGAFPPTFYGVSPPIAQLPGFVGPTGPVTGSVALVGTANRTTDQGGIGISYTFPTPAGMFVLYANVRQDQLTVAQAAALARGQPLRDTKEFNVNGGFLYSLSDGAIKALAVANPSLSETLQQISSTAGAHVFAGVNWKGSLQFDAQGKPSFRINGLPLPLHEVPRLARQTLNELKQSLAQPTPPSFTPELPQTSALERDFWGRIGRYLFAAGESPWAFGRTQIELGPDGKALLSNLPNGVGTLRFRPFGRPGHAIYLQYCSALWCD